MRNNNGMTLIETIVSLGVFMLITLSVINMTAFTSRALERISARGELLENARIALDMMGVYIKAADSIVIETDGDNKGLRLMTVTASPDVREFRYNSGLPPGNVRYHRLEFGGNELASYIAGVSVKLEGDILTLSVTTDDRVDGGIAVEPVSLTMKMKVYCNVTM